MLRTSRCRSCIHFREGHQCAAFPEGIPREVYWWFVPHLKPMDGQEEDFVYEPKDGLDKYFSNYLELARELSSKRKEIERKIVIEAKSVIKHYTQNEQKVFKRIEVRLHTGQSRMANPMDEILFIREEGAELIAPGKKSTLFLKLNEILFVESVENHKTDLEFIMDNLGNYTLEFANYSRLERLDRNKEFHSARELQQKRLLAKQGLTMITDAKLKAEIKSILDEGDEENLPKNRHIMESLREKGFAVMLNEVYRVRKSLERNN